MHMISEAAHHHIQNPHIRNELMNYDLITVNSHTKSFDYR